MAWMVQCQGHHSEFDHLIYADQEEAEIKAEEFNDDEPEGEGTSKAIPLYEWPEAEIDGLREAVRVLAEAYHGLTYSTRAWGTGTDAIRNNATVLAALKKAREA
jgi:hypothetical protein